MSRPDLWCLCGTEGSKMNVSKLIKGFGPIILIYLLVALVVSALIGDYRFLYAAIAGPGILSVGVSIPFAIVFWLSHVFGDDW